MDGPRKPPDKPAFSFADALKSGMKAEFERELAKKKEQAPAKSGSKPAPKGPKAAPLADVQSAVLKAWDRFDKKISPSFQFSVGGLSATVECSVSSSDQLWNYGFGIPPACRIDEDDADAMGKWWETTTKHYGHALPVKYDSTLKCNVINLVIDRDSEDGYKLNFHVGLMKSTKG